MDLMILTDERNASSPWHWANADYLHKIFIHAISDQGNVNIKKKHKQKI